MGYGPTGVVFADLGPVSIALPFLNRPIRILPDQVGVVFGQGQRFGDLALLVIALQRKVDAPHRQHQKRQERPK